MFRLLLEIHINTMGSLYSAVGIAAFFVFLEIEPGFLEIVPAFQENRAWLPADWAGID